MLKNKVLMQLHNLNHNIKIVKKLYKDVKKIGNNKYKK